MSTEPYVPNEYTAKQMYVLQRQSMHNHISPDYGAEFDRFIAKVRADALREFVSAAQDLLNCSGDTRWMARALARADLIEGEA